MRVLMISKALTVGAYHKKGEELARRGIGLHVVIPPRWGKLSAEITHTTMYSIHVLPCYLSGRNHLHFYRGLEQLLERVQPTVLHIDEESYSVVTFQAMRLAVKQSLPALFFNWQNIYKVYPFPFSAVERYNIQHATIALAGNEGARDVLRRKGCKIPIYVIPQFGVDPTIFSKHDSRQVRRQLFGSADVKVLGYAGRLVPEKGVLILLDAFAGLPAEARLLFIGEGPLRDELRTRTTRYGMEERVVVLDRVPSEEMPRLLSCLYCLILPSIAGPSWKEQFGRVLIEAMACEVAVIGTNSGEIPNVIGNAGIIVPEGNTNALHHALRRLLQDPQERDRLAFLGRERVLAHYTQERIVAATLRVYREMAGDHASESS